MVQKESLIGGQKITGGWTPDNSHPGSTQWKSCVTSAVTWQKRAWLWTAIPTPWAYSHIQ